MDIGVPREIKPHEYRVGVTPEAAREYRRAGHGVFVETDAGVGIGASDDDYRRVGATILETSAEIFGAADMIVKVKEPQASEWRQLRPAQILFAYLHLAPDPLQAHGLADSGCIAVAYETVTDERGGLPLLTPMSEVAGRLALEASAMALRPWSGGRGVLLAGVPGVRPAIVVIIGGGVVGRNAARMFVSVGAEVTVLDHSLAALREVDNLFEGRVRTRYATLAALEHELSCADVVIGAVLIPGARAPRLVTKQLVSSMRKGAAIVDVAIDQGGCFETARPTTHDNPTYQVDGIVHYCVANMPAAVPLSSSFALNNATLPFGLALAAHGVDAIRGDDRLKAGVNVYRGHITNKAVAESLGLPFMPIEEHL